MSGCGVLLSAAFLACNEWVKDSRGYERLAWLIERLRLGIERLTGAIERMSCCIERLAGCYERLAGCYERMRRFIERGTARHHPSPLPSNKKRQGVPPLPLVYL